MEEVSRGDSVKAMTLISFQTCIMFFLLYKTKRDVKKNVHAALFLASLLDYIVWKITVNVVPKIFFCVLQKVIRIWHDMRLSKC